MLHFYFGNGKGKTSAAFGAAMRYAQYGRSAVIQFLKDGTSGEAQFVKSVESDRLLYFTAHKNHDFYAKLDDREKAAVRNECRANLFKAYRLLDDGVGLIVLDEAVDCVELGIFDVVLLTDFAVRCRERQCELIITGHARIDEFVAAADFCTEFVCVSHPFTDGGIARRGIEY